MSAFHLLHTPLGIRIVSFILGLGLASLFYTTCQGSGCLRFVAPKLDELEAKIFRASNGKGCMKYELEPNSCQSHLATIEVNAQSHS